MNNPPPLPQPSGATCSNCGAAQPSGTLRCSHCGALIASRPANAMSSGKANCLTFFLTVSAFFIGICGFIITFSVSSFIPVAIAIMATTLLLVGLCVWRIRQIIKSP